MNCSELNRQKKEKPTVEYLRFTRAGNVFKVCQLCFWLSMLIVIKIDGIIYHSYLILTELNKSKVKAN
jgi:hypothetical protein